MIITYFKAINDKKQLNDLQTREDSDHNVNLPSLNSAGKFIHVVPWLSFKSSV